MPLRSAMHHVTTVVISRADTRSWNFRAARSTVALTTSGPRCRRGACRVWRSPRDVDAHSHLTVGSVADSHSPPPPGRVGSGHTPPHRSCAVPVGTPPAPASSLGWRLAPPRTGGQACPAAGRHRSWPGAVGAWSSQLTSFRRTGKGGTRSGYGWADTRLLERQLRTEGTPATRRAQVGTGPPAGSPRRRGDLDSHSALDRVRRRSATVRRWR